MDIENHFSTRSLPLIAFLFAREASFVRIDRKENIAYFIFTGCNEIVKEYFSGGQVVASSYWSALQTAKDLIYGGKQ